MLHNFVAVAWRQRGLVASTLSQLPNPHSIFRIEIKLLSSMHVKELVPDIAVAYGVGTVSSWRMLVGVDSPTQFSVPHFRTVGLRVRNKVLLVSRKPVRLRCGVAF
jgi:hypothetical protein